MARTLQPISSMNANRSNPSESLPLSETVNPDLIPAEFIRAGSWCNNSGAREWTGYGGCANYFELRDRCSRGE